MNFDWFTPHLLAASAQPTSALDIAQLKQAGIRNILTLTEKPLWELVNLSGAPEMNYLHVPIPDGQPPTLPDAFHAISWLSVWAAQGQPTLIHCREGIGRTGTLLHVFIIAQGTTLGFAKTSVANLRPANRWEALTEPQRQWLECIV